MDSMSKDIVISSRIRLARNFEDFNFPIRLSDDDAKKVVANVWNSLNVGNNFVLHTLSKMDINSCVKYLERHMISRELLDNKDISAFITNKAENVVVMINEEDHVREQCILKGFALDEAYEKLCEIDKSICENNKIAWSEELGYLTACPSNLGTGMRASVMMFLPALTKTGAIGEVIKTYQELGFAVRGCLGEGSEAQGYLYQISNQTTMGQSEEQIIGCVKNVAKKVCELENEAREILFQTKCDQIKDATYRAYGILSNSYMMTESEFTKLLSDLRLGYCLGLIEFRNPNILEEIEVSSQPANLIERFGEELNEEKKNKFRADYLCRALKNQRI